MKYRLTENRLRAIIQETVKSVLIESNISTKIQPLIDDANRLYKQAYDKCGDFFCMDRQGNSYQLDGEITFDGTYVTIPFDYGYNKSYEQIRVVDDDGKLFHGDYFEEGWQDVKKYFKKLFKDCERGIKYFEQYDPNWEEAENKEEYETNKQAMKDMNKRVGINAKAGLDNINKRY